VAVSSMASTSVLSTSSSRANGSLPPSERSEAPVRTGTWKSPTSPGLTFAERDLAYKHQCWLHAVKACAMCGEILVVTEFEAWGDQPCKDCYLEVKRRRRAGW